MFENLEAIIIIGVIAVVVILFAFLFHKYPRFRTIFKNAISHEEVAIMLITMFLGDTITKKETRKLKYAILEMYEMLKKYSKKGDLTQEEIEEYIDATLCVYGIESNEIIIRTVARILDQMEELIKEQDA